MSGKNKYYELQRSVKKNFSYGRDLEDLILNSRKPPPTKPCVFLSHISSDKGAVNEIADYFGEAGVDYYLDVNDSKLQQAVEEKDDEKITQFIELGIKNSTHLLTIVSEETQNSWWVPFEVSYGKHGKIDLASLIIKDLSDPPSYLKITRKISGIESLNKYIEDIKRPIINVCFGNVYSRSFPFGGGNIVAHNSTQHPLRKHLRK